MRDLVAIIGANPFGVASYRQSWRASWAQVLYQRARVLHDSEANLWQQVVAHEVARLGMLCGAGVVLGMTPGSAGVANQAQIHTGVTPLRCVVDGVLVQVRAANDAQAITITLSAAPASGTRTDLIWLEVAHVEIQPTTSPEAASSAVYNKGNDANSTLLTNDLITSGVQETARRVQQQYHITATAGVSTLIGMSTHGYGWQPDTEQPGVWVAGDGTAAAGVALGSVDGYRRAIILATVARTAGESSIAAAAITPGQSVKLASSSDTLDGIHATAAPTANALLALNSSGQYPISVFTGLPGSGANVDMLDGFHANATPTPNTLLPLNGSGQIPVAAIRSGAGGGVNSSTVDTYPIAASPVTNTLLPLNSSGQYPAEAIPGGINVDRVDGYHASNIGIPSCMIPLDSSARYPLAVMHTGSGGGIFADSVDSYHVGSGPNLIAPYNSGAKMPWNYWQQGPGSGIDLDMVDNLHASDLALTGHSHSVGTNFWLSKSDTVGSGPVTESANFNQRNLFTTTIANGSTMIFWISATFVINIISGSFVPVFYVRPNGMTILNANAGSSITVGGRNASGWQTLSGVLQFYATRSGTSQIIVEWSAQSVTGSFTYNYYCHVAICSYGI